MTTLRMGLLASATALLPLSTPQAQETLWKTVGDWDVKAVSDTRCEANRKSPDPLNTTLFIAAVVRDGAKRITLTLQNPGWKAVETGQTYPLVMSFDRGKPTEASGMGLNMGASGGMVSVSFGDSEAFGRSFARFRRMTASYEGKPLAETDLKGSFRAYGEVLKCVDAKGVVPAAVVAAAPPPAAFVDPFAKAGAPAAEVAPAPAPAPQPDTATVTPAPSPDPSTSAAPTDVAVANPFATPAPAPAATTAKARPDPLPAGSSGAECDRLAANVADATRPESVAPVRFSEIDHAAAIPACEKAVAENPDLPRLAYEHGRALAAAERLPDSVAAYRKAADEGHPLAQMSLGTAYRDGDGVEKSETEAFAWYSKAADAGVPFAALQAGFALADGKGVAADPAKALDYYRRAAEGGDIDAGSAAQAAMWVGRAYQTGAGVAVNLNEAVAWMTRGAEGGYPLAQLSLGQMYENGLGVSADKAAAIDWYRKAAAGSNEGVAAEAQASLARLGAG